MRKFQPFLITFKGLQFYEGTLRGESVIAKLSPNFMYQRKAKVLENLEIGADLEAAVTLSITMNGNTEHLDAIGGVDRSRVGEFDQSLTSSWKANLYAEGHSARQRFG